MASQHIHPTAKPYDRETCLPALVAMWPYEIEDFSEAGCENVISKVEKALRGERQRGKAGHWTYNLARHMSLLKAFKAEKNALERIKTRKTERFKTARVLSR